MCFAQPARMLPSRAFSSICEVRTFTTANSAATKKPLAKTKKRVSRISAIIFKDTSDYNNDSYVLLVIRLLRW